MSHVVVPTCMIDFDTEKEAKAQLVLDLAFHLDEHSDDKEYCDSVPAWQIARQRKDGKWEYLACPGQDYGDKVLTDFDEDNYAG